MSEPRTKEQLQADYNRLCAEVGHRVYQIRAIDKDINTILAQMLSLNEEHKGIVDQEATSAEVSNG